MKARLQFQLVDPQQNRAADDQREADDPRVEQHVFDEAMRQRADDGSGQKCNENADHKAPRGGIIDHPERNSPQS